MIEVEKRGKGLVVLSGGLDSTCALAFAKEECVELGAISFDYGQKHSVELESARAVADYYNIPWALQKVPGIPKRGSLLDPGAEMPHQTYEELMASQGPSPTYVPFRNGTFLSLAAAHAQGYGYDYLYAGMHGEDAHNWAYPDCTPEFIGSMQNAIYVGTYHQVRLIVPFTYMTKEEVAGFGLNQGAPLHLTHSCYEGKRPACGKCPTCVERLEAFKSLGAVDPIPYAFDQYRGVHIEVREA